MDALADCNFIYNLYPWKFPPPPPHYRLYYYDVQSFIDLHTKKSIYENWNIEDSYLFLYYEISVDALSFVFSSIISNCILGGKYSIFYNTLPSTPVQEEKKKNRSQHVFEFINKSI